MDILQIDFNGKCSVNRELSGGLIAVIVLASLCGFFCLSACVYGAYRRFHASEPKKNTIGRHTQQIIAPSSAAVTPSVIQSASVSNGEANYVEEKWGMSGLIHHYSNNSLSQNPSAESGANYNENGMPSQFLDQQQSRGSYPYDYPSPYNPEVSDEDPDLSRSSSQVSIDIPDGLQTISPDQDSISYSNNPSNQSTPHIDNSKDYSLDKYSSSQNEFNEFSEDGYSSVEEQQQHPQS